MTGSDPKTHLHQYLREGRTSVLSKLDGLSEYDVRRPLVPTGTNLLGLVKHLASVEAGYFGETFGRPYPEPMPWWHDDATIETLPLDAPGQVPWWRPTGREATLHRILVHVLAETHRHAGHADIVRELIDGTVGWRRVNDNLPDVDQTWWESYRDRLERTAQSFR